MRSTMRWRWPTVSSRQPDEMVPAERSPGLGKELLIRIFVPSPLHHAPSIALRVAESLPA